MSGSIITSEANKNMLVFTGDCTMEVGLHTKVRIDASTSFKSHATSNLILDDESEYTHILSDARMLVNHKFDINNVLLKGVILKNTEFAILAAMFTGMNTRVMKSRIKSRTKHSKLEERLNRI